VRTKDADFSFKPFSLAAQRCFDVRTKSFSVGWMDSISHGRETAEHSCARGIVGVKRIEASHNVPHYVPLKADHGNRAQRQTSYGGI
jgi:hypothetical protein